MPTGTHPVDTRRSFNVADVVQTFYRRSNDVVCLLGMTIDKKQNQNRKLGHPKFSVIDNTPDAVNTDSFKVTTETLEKDVKYVQI